MNMLLDRASLIIKLLEQDKQNADGSHTTLGNKVKERAQHYERFH